MKHFHSFLLFLVASLCLTASVPLALGQAQSIRFRMMPWDTEPDALFIASGTSYEPLRGLPNHLSHEYRASGGSPLVLYRMQPQADDAPPVFAPMQTLPFSGEAERYILFLFRAATPGGQQRAVLYPFNQTGEFRSGLTIFNFTTHRVAAQVGEQLVNLAPQQNHFMPAAALPLDNYSFLCKIAGDKDNRWRLIYNNFITVPPNSSVLFFITSDPNANPEDDDLKVMTKRIVDYDLSETTRKREIDVKRVGTEINY